MFDFKSIWIDKNTQAFSKKIKFSLWDLKASDDKANIFKFVGNSDSAEEKPEDSLFIKGETEPEEELAFLTLLS